MSGKPKKRYNKSVYRSFTMIVQFGLNMLVPICMLSALGVFLDKKLGTSWIMILLFFMGAIAGGQNVYRMAKQVYGSEKQGAEQGREKAGTKNDSGMKEQKDVFKNK